MADPLARVDPLVGTPLAGGDNQIGSGFHSVVMYWEFWPVYGMQMSLFLRYHDWKSIEKERESEAYLGKAKWGA